LSTASVDSDDGGAAATDVAVDTRIYAGNGTDGDVVWEGAGGWITVRTTIQSAEETVTVTQRRQVA
jgi:Rieske Fe-S protein